MANFDQLKQSVAALIRTNGAEEITGQIMQDVLLTIINSISGGYMFGGVAQHNGNVGNPDYNVFYLAGSGAYTGYGGAITIENGCYGVFRYNGTWHQEVVDIGVRLSGSIVAGETRGVTGDTINTALQTLFDNVMNILDSLTFTYNTPSAQQATKAMLDVIMTPTGGAPHVLTTLTLASATVAAAGLMSAEDKQKVDRMLTDFRSLSLTDTTAAADQATKIVQTLSATLGENPEAITTMTFLAATASKAGLMSAADKAVLDCLVAMLGYYECSTAAGTAAKVVSASGYSLTSGGCIRIKMTNANTANNVTLNINSTGAKALYYDGAQASSTNTWEAGEVLEVYYDGTQYQCASGGDGEIKTELNDNWDFAVADTNGHVVLCIKDGHVFTKNFKSSALAIGVGDLTKENCAYAVMDANGNMAFVITEDGHIVTKNFCSRDVSQESLAVLAKLADLVNKFNGKCIAVIGDSISTYNGYIPTGWRYYYPNGNVNDVSLTYWQQVATWLGMTVQNCAYSASSVTGDSTQQTVSPSAERGECAGCSDVRIAALTRDSKTPDIVLILLGTNDYGAGKGLGTWDEHSAIPSEGTINQFSSAYALMLNKIKTALPNARIFCCTLLQRNFSFPDSTISLKQYNDVIKQMASIFGCDVIDTYACGISRYNIASYTVDGAVHPNAAGHALIAHKVFTELISKY